MSGLAHKVRRMQHQDEQIQLSTMTESTIQEDLHLISWTTWPLGVVLHPPTSEAPPSWAAAGELDDPGGKHEAKEQPSQQPEGGGVMVLRGGLPQQVQWGHEDG